MKKILAVLLMLPFHLILSQIPKNAYIVNSLGENLSVINLEQNSVNNNAEALGLFPNQIKVFKEKAYIINSGLNEVQVIDLQSENTIQNIDLGSGTNPYAMDFVDDTTLAVSLLLSNQLAFVNLKTAEVMKTVNVGLGPEGVHHLNGKVYVANTGYTFQGYEPGTVSVVSVNDGSVYEIPVGINPQDVTRDSKNRIIVACTGNYDDVSGQLYVIDSDQDTVSFFADTGTGITTVAVNGMDKAYLGTFGSGVLVYDLEKRTFERDVQNLLPGGPGIDFDALNNAYVTDFTVDSLYVYSVDHHRIAAYLVGDGPLSVALYDPSFTSLAGQNIAKLNTFTLSQNYPNPFNPETMILFEISSRRMVKLDIFNALGQPVRTLINQVKSPGSYQAKWNGENKEGIRVSSGIYFYRLQFGHMTKTKTMHVLR